MSYSNFGLCLEDLEVIKPAYGIASIRCSNWKECPFFCPEESHEKTQVKSTVSTTSRRDLIFVIPEGVCNLIQYVTQ